MITTLYASLLAFLYMALSFLIIKGRWKYKIGLGEGGNPEMVRLIRMHGNFAEFVPFALLLLLMLDLAHFSPVVIHILGIMLVLGRVLHAIGIHKSQNFTPARGLGVVLTFAVIIVSAFLLLWIFFVLRAASL